MEPTGFANGLGVKDDTKVFWPRQKEELSLYEFALTFQLERVEE